jgi:hypothetical protein
MDALKDQFKLRVFKNSDVMKICCLKRGINLGIGDITSLFIHRIVLFG